MILHKRNTLHFEYLMGDAIFFEHFLSLICRGFFIDFQEGEQTGVNRKKEKNAVSLLILWG